MHDKKGKAQDKQDSFHNIVVVNEDVVMENEDKEVYKDSNSGTDYCGCNMNGIEWEPDTRSDEEAMIRT